MSACAAAGEFANWSRVGAYHSMEFASFVALRPSLWILAFASAELTEILSRLWRFVGIELHLDPAEWLAYMKD